MDLTKENYFEELSKAGLEISKKWKFSYSSWADVWEALKTKVPDVKYEWVENQNGTLWLVDDYWCFAKVRVYSEDLWVDVTQYLHAMDFNNKAIQKEKLTASEINKAYQRCMVKAIATWFWLGLYIYRWEDLPDESDWNHKPNKKLEESRKALKQEKKKIWFNYDNFMEAIQAWNKTEDDFKKLIEEDWFSLSAKAWEAISAYVKDKTIIKY